MSRDACIDFVKQLSTDAALNAEADRAAEGGGTAAVVALAARRGFSFSVAEADAVRAELTGTGGRELTDAALAQVAGGTGNTSIGPTSGGKGGKVTSW